jgi:hypothetical protein
MKLRPFLAALALAGAVACSDNNTPTAPTNLSPQPSAPELKKQQTGSIIIPTNQAFTDITNTLTATVTQIQITDLALNSANQLVASGILTIDFAGQTITRTFSDVVLSLTTPSGQCQILHLDLGPLFLDVLGLQINLSEVVLDITAVSGPGNLLGNLLCSLVHLLDQSPLPLAEILDLLANINRLLV